MILRKRLCDGSACVEIEIDGETATHRVIGEDGKAHTTWSMPCSSTNFGSKRAMIAYCREHGYKTVA
jgi:hypothetical protein